MPTRSSAVLTRSSEAPLLTESLAQMLDRVTDEQVRNWQQAKGWTGADVQVLLSQARLAAARGALTDARGQAWFGAEGIVGRLLTAWNATARVQEPALPEVALLPWLAVAVGAPDTWTFYEIRRIILAGQVPMTSNEWRRMESAARAWRALGWPGALAYAAGLDLAETTRRANAGAFAAEAETLAGLAALRGWITPPHTRFPLG